MLSAKLKWFSFLFGGCSIHILATAVFFYFLPETTVFKTILFFACFLISWVVITVIIAAIFSKDKFIFLTAPIYLFKKRKWVYHNKLGWFLIFIDKKNIDIIKVSPLYFSEKTTVQNTGKIKEMAKMMKIRLDDVYKNFLVEKAEKDAEKIRLDDIKNWDGLLIDDDERRDLRIDNILKNKNS